ncbi:rhamnulokinase family protein [Dysgonomonas sp. 520]|uniref:rhamnulokinase n=1 Tax=Dysgonomonas sp. 520 TaxID=2302931 RepID=UPI0013D44C4F|nr:rhamnulokinase family protein [Dysgonomonas sp. 520]NDW09002.1 rhamnulokinase [Dysgonomonas sp. 520]
MKTYNFLAFDIGATSGRSIIGTLKEGKLVLNELTRFPNNIVKIQGKFYWDIYALFGALKDALKEVADKKITIDAIGIDTWGVDFVYLGEDGSLLGLPRCYRDPYTNNAPEEYFKLLSRQEVYDLTGIQIMNFNSLFQLYAAKKENSSALKAATDILFMPDALSYLLTNKKVCEYTIASTAQLINPHSKKIENKLLEVIGIDPSIIQPIIMPGEKIGNITEDIKKECGLSDIPVVSVAGHDTGSAVAAVPAQNENFAYLSSGTWSLMGIELKEPVITKESYDLNFTNEGGVDGTIRFLKNITGMWLLEQCRKEWEAKGTKYSYPEIVVLSDSVDGFKSLIDPDDASFANPESMIQAITTYCKKTEQKAPETHAEFIRCIFDSLALKYRFVLECLQKIAPFKIERLHVIGGGSQNKLLNQMTANSIGLPVIAGPSEATAIGNIMLQAQAVGAVGSLKEMRAVINQSVTPEIFEPQNKQLWDEAYNQFFRIMSS